jgi:hypothetical protein
VTALPVDPDDFERDEFADLDATADYFDGDRAVDDLAAEKALRAVRFIDRQLARWEALAKAEHARIDAWLAETCNPLAGRREFFERCLEGYTRANHEATGAKSVKLPSGTLALRRTPDRVEPLPDSKPQERFARVTVAWDKNRVKEATNPGPILEDYDPPEGFIAREAVDTAGERVPGVVWLCRVEPSFSVKVSGS